MQTIKTNKFPIVTIVAVSKDFIIGDGNQMLWHLPNDLKRLKSITLGNPLIMGRKTFDSIGKPLPGRANIVLTNKRNLKDEKKRIVRELNKKKDGGSLKPVNPKTQKGLSKLPTKVRNKMGYMKKGGRVFGGGKK